MILGILQFISVIWITFLEYKRKSPMVFMWSTLLVMFAMMHLRTIFIKDYIYGEDVLNEASLFVIFFCFFYFIVRFIFLKKEKFNYNLLIEKENDKKIANLMCKVLFFSVALYIFLVLKTSGSLIEVNKNQIYTTMSTKGIYFLISTYLYYATTPIIFYYIRKKEKKKVFMITVAILLRVLISSTRMEMVILFVAIIGNIEINLKNNSTKKMLILGIIGVITIYLIYALRVFRYYYSLKDIFYIDLSDLNKKIFEFVEKDDGVLGLRKVFYYFISNNNDFKGFGELATYKRLLLLPIPSRFTFGLKPEDMCLTMGNAWKPYFKGIIRFSMTPTLFGECYANFGFWGCFLGIIWGVIAKILDKLVCRKNEILRYMFFAIVGTSLINTGRGDVYNSMGIIWYGIIITLFLYHFENKFLNFKMKIKKGKIENGEKTNKRFYI